MDELRIAVIHAARSVRVQRQVFHPAPPTAVWMLCAAPYTKKNGAALLPSPWWDGPLFGAAGSSLDGSHSDASSSGSSAGLAAQQPVADLWLLFLMILCVGFASGAMWPPLFEIAAEITFPVSESTSGGFLGLTCNGGGVIFLYLPSIVATH